MLHFIKALPYFLLRLSLSMRLFIIVLFYLISVLLLLTLLRPTLNGSLFAIPVGLATWLFRKKGAYLSLASVLLTLLLIFCLDEHGIIWPAVIYLSFLAGSAALFIEVFIIGYLRISLDAVQAAQEQCGEAVRAKQQLESVYEQQRQVNILKDQFIVNVNHELRTPLTEVYGYVELLREYQEKLDSATHTRFLYNASEGCKELNHLVNNVLDALTVSDGSRSVHCEHIYVKRIVHDMVEQTFGHSERLQHIHINIPEQLTAWGNQQYLRQVLRNLLSNAGKYTPPRSSILIKSEMLEHEDSPNEVCISVQDSGPGIPPGEQPLLFHKFVRLKRDLLGNVRGSGLGLYVSKQLIEAVSGRIWVESTGIAGEGCRFRFTLPVAPISRDTAVEEKETPLPLEPLRVFTGKLEHRAR